MVEKCGGTRGMRAGILVESERVGRSVRKLMDGQKLVESHITAQDMVS